MHQTSAFADAVLEAERRIAAGEIRFPQYLDELAAAGVVRYRVDVATRRVEYEGSDGDGMAEEPVPEERPLDIAPDFDRRGVITALQAARRREVDFPSFVRCLAEAGCSIYYVETIRRVAIYSGRGGCYVAKIPEVLRWVK